MTTKKRPTIAELQAKLAEAEQALQAKQAENEALQARIPTPRVGKKAGNYEPARDGAPAACHNGARGIPVTYPAGSLRGMVADILELALSVFGEEEFTTTDLKAIMYENMKSAGGNRLYANIQSANTGAQRVRNAVYEALPDGTRQVVPGFPFPVPFTLTDRGRALVWKLNPDGVQAILEYAKS